MSVAVINESSGRYWLIYPVSVSVINESSSGYWFYYHISVSVIDDSSGGYWLIVAAGAVSLLPLMCFCCWCILCLVGVRRRKMKGTNDPWREPYPWGNPNKLEEVHHATPAPVMSVQVWCSITKVTWLS